MVQNTPFGAGAERRGAKGRNSGDRRPQKQKADLCRPAEGQQGQCRHQQDLRQSRSFPGPDGLSARRRPRLDHLIAIGLTHLAIAAEGKVSRAAECSPHRRIASAQLNPNVREFVAEHGRHRRAAATSGGRLRPLGRSFDPPSSRRGICRHSAVGARFPAVLFSMLLLALGKVPDRIFRARRTRRLRHIVLAPEHAATLFAADPDCALRGAAGAHWPRDHRRRRRARARRLCGRCCRHPAGARPCACPADALHHGFDRHACRRLLDRHRRLSSLRPRRQRNHLVAADDLYRHRHHEFFRRGIAARSLQSQQAFDHADRRRLYGR